MKIGSSIVAKRKAIGLSQDNFAEKLHVARQTVSSWEHDVFFPDSKNLISISNILGCSLDELVNSSTQELLQDTREKGNVIEFLLRAWKGATDAVKAMDPAILADGMSEQERVAIINEGREAILSLETALNWLES